VECGGRSSGACGGCGLQVVTGCRWSRRCGRGLQVVASRVAGGCFAGCRWWRRRLQVVASQVAAYHLRLDMGREGIRVLFFFLLGCCRMKSVFLIGLAAHLFFGQKLNLEEHHIF